MADKKFWNGMDPRVGGKRTDKIMVGNVDNSETEFENRSDILKSLEKGDFPTVITDELITTGERAKLVNVPSNTNTAISTAKSEAISSADSNRVADKTATVTSSTSTKVTQEGAVFKFRHKNYPFKDNLYTYKETQTGSVLTNLADVVKEARVDFKSSGSLVTDKGTKKRMYIGEIGSSIDNLNFYAKIFKESSTYDTFFEEDTVSVVKSGDSDDENLVLSIDEPTYYIELICDATALDDDKIIELTINDTEVSPLLVSKPVVLTNSITSPTSTDAPQESAVFTYRRNQYPFLDSQYTYLETLNEGTLINLALLVKEFKVEFKYSYTDYTTVGTKKRFFLKSAGLSMDETTYYFRYFRETNTRGSFTEEVISVLVADVTDNENILFELDEDSFVLSAILDMNYLDDDDILLADINACYGVSQFHPNTISLSTTTDSLIQVFPFAKRYLPFTSAGYNMGDLFKKIKIVYKSSSKVATNGDIKKHYLKGFGKNVSDELFVIFGITSADGLNVYEYEVTKPISEVEDISAVEMNYYSDSRDIYSLLDFTEAQDLNVDTVNLYNRTLISDEYVFDDNDFIPVQKCPNEDAFTHSYAMMKRYRNQLDDTNDVYDGSYSFWCAPIAQTSADGVSRLNFVNRSGNQMHWNVSTEETLNFSTQKVPFHDEHDTPAMLLMSNGKWMSMYTGHNDDKLLRVRTNYMKESEVTQPTTTELGTTRETVIFLDDIATYCQLLEYDSKVFAFFRSPASAWRWIVSEDFGKTWSEPKDIMVQGGSSYNRVYIIAKMVDGEKWMKVYNYFEVESNDDNRVGYFAVDMDTMLAYDKENGNQIGDLNTAGVGMDECKVLYNALTGQRIRLLDGASGGLDEAIFTVADFDVSTGDTGSYKYINYDLDNDTSTIATIVAHGGFFTHTYLGGAYIQQSLTYETAATPIVYTSRNDSGTWRIEKWSISSGTATLVTEIANSSTSQLVRPIPPVGATLGVGVEVFYIDGEYLNNSFTEFKTRIKAVNF